MVLLEGRPPYAPCHCILCRRDDNGPFIDRLGEDVLGQRIYVCFQCVADMGALFGLASAAEVTKLKEKAAVSDVFSARAEAAEAELERVRESVSLTLREGAVGTEDLTLRPPKGKRKVHV